MPRKWDGIHQFQKNTDTLIWWEYRHLSSLKLSTLGEISKTISWENVFQKIHSPL